MASNPLAAMGKMSDLKRRLVFLVLALIVFRIGTHVPVPGIDPVALTKLFDTAGGGILGMFNMFSGGALSRFSVFAFFLDRLKRRINYRQELHDDRCRYIRHDSQGEH